MVENEKSHLQSEYMLHLQKVVEESIEPSIRNQRHYPCSGRILFPSHDLSSPVYAPQNTVQEVEAAPLQKGVFFFETSFLIQARE